MMLKMIKNKDDEDDVKGIEDGKDYVKDDEDDKDGGDIRCS